MSWIKERILKGDKGLGDTIERFTKATGIKNMVERLSEFSGKDCMCNKRKKLLNEYFSYDRLSVKNRQILKRLISTEKYHLKS
jgi:hypothetical protein|tara:strand:- start:332 stop:580 length:249 start_codon:yes stop_codon:yes gene_type:complete